MTDLASFNLRYLLILPSPSSHPARLRRWEWTKGRFELFFPENSWGSQAVAWAGEAEPRSISAGDEG